MGRIVGIDYGEKRIGVAVSDPTGMLATPDEVIHVESRKKAIGRIREKCGEWQAEKIVVGLPIHMSGEKGELAGYAEQFAEDLQKRVSIPVIMWDERLSTKSAERVLLEAGTSREKRKHVIDKLAAQQILQNYLDAQDNAFPPAEPDFDR